MTAQLDWPVSRKKDYIRLRDYYCAYCLDGIAETVDHIIPQAEGGTNAGWNLVGSCQKCNHSKASHTLPEVGLVLHPTQRLLIEWSKATHKQRLWLFEYIGLSTTISPLAVRTHH